MLSAVKIKISRLIALNSISCTLNQYDQSNLMVIEQLKEWFDELQFSSEVMPVAQGKANLVATFSHPDFTEEGLILSGHTDTVPTDNALWSHDPFVLTEKDNKWYGLGIADMKSFFVLAWQALYELQQEGKLTKENLKAPITLIATSDEETSMAGARAIQHSGQKGRFALIGEPTNLQPIRAHKGVLLERILITGQAGHSSQPDLGNNALDAMHEVMGELMYYREHLKSIQNPIFNVPYTTMNFGCIHGGDNPNRICGLCELQFDIRPIPNVSVPTLQQDIKQLVAKVAEKRKIDIRYESLTDGIPPAETPETADFVKLLEKLSGQDSGVVGFGTEAPFYRALNMETVILGAGSIEQAHQPNEYLAIEHIRPMIDLIKKLVSNLCLKVE